ncbi:hypothetical protein ABEB36_014032 [Hypothenemus hampei]|uniref:Uncharacterized protein n=1 Tax=Hypothenemus hampei TaxID=57062 RepID=A0ABD1E331_HYPHA
MLMVMVMLMIILINVTNELNIQNQLLVLQVLLLLKIKKKRTKIIREKRRWGIRPVVRSRKQFGEYYTSFLKYKIIDHEWFFFYRRMTPSQFEECLSYVGPLLQKNSHREPLSPGQRLAMTLR